ncbi:unnamed protein product [Arctogadus glacialis]
MPRAGDEMNVTLSLTLYAIQRHTRHQQVVHDMSWSSFLGVPRTLVVGPDGGSAMALALTFDHFQILRAIGKGSFGKPHREDSAWAPSRHSEGVGKLGRE